MEKNKKDYLTIANWVIAIAAILEVVLKIFDLAGLIN